MSKKLLVGVTGSLMLASAFAQAAPITYTTLSNGVPAVGTVSSTAVETDPDAATYFRFFANMNDSVTITGTRLEFDFDMAFWVYEGLFDDTDDFGVFFSTGPGSGFIAFGDDQIPHPGPFGDPRVTFTAAVTGFYTIAVVNFASGTNDGDDDLFSFQVVAQGIPEPTAVALFGLGALGLGLVRRRRRG
jgi:hypothetical protein